MPYISPGVATLIGKKKVGNGDCVPLVREFTTLPSHLFWKPGERVLDNPHIRPGTAIATFVHERYQNKKTGNHAAFFLRYDAPGTGFWVVDQWTGKPSKPVRNIERHLIKVLGYKQFKDGNWYWASNNAEAFSIIEVK